MKVFPIIALSIIAIGGILYWLFTTPSTSTIYSGTYKNEKVVVKQIVKPGIVHSISHSVKLGGLKPVKIDYSSTDLEGIPYDDSIFTSVKHAFIDTSHEYENELNYDRFETITMLYISKSDFSEKEYLMYEDFFRNKWMSIQKELSTPSYNFPVKIVGVVHGDQQDFVHEFDGLYEKRKFTLEVRPDGEIILHPTGNTGSMQSSGFYNKVQMPGRILRQRGNEIGYYPNYDSFKDKKGKTIKDYFIIAPDTAQVTK
jgi:hypothetical protein